MGFIAKDVWNNLEEGCDEMLEAARRRGAVGALVLMVVDNPDDKESVAKVKAAGLVGDFRGIVLNYYKKTQGEEIEEFNPDDVGRD